LGVENPRSLDFEDFDPEKIASHDLLIVVAATHYEGEPSDNTKKFYKWFKEELKASREK
jgi:sulfite reductase alpha subunit-like flavoprotein